MNCRRVYRLSYVFCPMYVFSPLSITSDVPCGAGLHFLSIVTRNSAGLHLAAMLM